jgi:hypothetical protein
MHLAKRPAKTGNQMPSRGEMHGEETVTALDVPLTDIMLDETELGEIMQQPLAASALFNDGDGTRAPFFQNIKPIALDSKIEGATVTITHGVGNESIRLVNVKLAKIKLAPCIGGMTAMSCTVQSTPDLNADVARLLGRMNSTVDVEILCDEFGKQEELPMERRATMNDLAAHRGRGSRVNVEGVAT